MGARLRRARAPPPADSGRRPAHELRRSPFTSPPKGSRLQAEGLVTLPRRRRATFHEIGRSPFTFSPKGHDLRPKARAPLARRRRCTFHGLARAEGAASTPQDLAPPIGTECRPGSFCDSGRASAAPVTLSKRRPLHITAHERSAASPRPERPPARSRPRHHRLPRVLRLGHCPQPPDVGPQKSSRPGPSETTAARARNVVARSGAYLPSSTLGHARN
jgi:hypothetical protein